MTTDQILGKIKTSKKIQIPSMTMIIATEKGIEIPCQDFADATFASLQRNVLEWVGANNEKPNREYIVTLCEPAEPGKESDQIAMPIEDENGRDGGYFHLYGWKTKAAQPTTP